MSRITRRSVLGGAMAGALFGVTAAPAPLWAAKSIRIPAGPMRLIRRLERGMRGGVVLVVEREWQVEFAVRVSGFAISGEQTAAAVDAPSALASLAQIERTRSTAGMFPILLEPDGTIAATGQYTQASDVGAAVKKAEAIIADRAIPGEAKTLQMRYLAQLQRATSSLLKQLPGDLFFPSAPPSHAVRPVALPDGLQGEFEVSYEARHAPDRPWLERAERRVVTRIGQSERRSREVWTMAAI